MTFFRVSQRGDLPLGDTFVTNFHVESSQVLSSIHATCEQAVVTFWGVLKAHLPVDTVLRDVITTELNPANGKNVSALETSPNIAGTGIGTASPQNACILISLRTANASKSGRGRQYYPAPVTTDLNSDGSLNNTVALAIDAAFGQLATTINGAGNLIVQHGGFTGRVNGVPQYTLLSSSVVTSTQVSEILATQRRRTNKVTPRRTTFIL
jgi:hypothetical protein